MSINNTLNYTSLLKPKPGLPTNSTVPNILGSLNPTQGALTNKINGQSSTPSWQTTLANVQKASPTPNVTTSSTGGQSLIPTKPIATTGLVKPPIQNTSSTTSTPITPTTPPPVTVPPPSTPPISTPPQNTTPTYSGLISGLVGAGAKTESEQNATAQQISDLRQNLQTGLGGIQAQPETLNYGVGRQNQLIQQEAAKESALQGQLQSQIAAGSQNIGALGTAAGYAAPKSVSPTETLVNPQTNTPSYGLGTANTPGGGSSTGANALSDYAKMQQNIAQGQSTQQQSFMLDTATKQLDVIKPVITGFLASTGLNSTANPHLNDSLNSYYKEFLGPSNAQQFSLMLGDVKKYTSQILSEGSGTIPTDVANTLASFDPSNLNVQGLTDWMTTLRQLGENQKAVLQSQINPSYGGGTNAYGGEPTTPNTTPPPASPEIPHTPVPKVGQAIIGTGMNLLGGIEGMISHFGSMLFGG